VNLDQLNELAKKIPVGLVFAAFCAYQAYLYYDFDSSPDAPLAAKKREIAAAKEARKKWDQKLQEANSFVRTLDGKKVELRKAALELQGMKETLSERLDIPAFMKMTITESKKLGINVVSLKPTGSDKKEFYTEQGFTLNVRCVFAQLVSFFERMSNVSDIVRVDNFTIRPITPATARYVMLDVVLNLKTYRYLGSNADKLSKHEGLTDMGTSISPLGSVPASQDASAPPQATAGGGK